MARIPFDRPLPAFLIIICHNKRKLGVREWLGISKRRALAARLAEQRAAHLVDAGCDVRVDDSRADSVGAVVADLQQILCLFVVRLHAVLNASLKLHLGLADSLWLNSQTVFLTTNLNSMIACSIATAAIHSLSVVPDTHAPAGSRRGHQAHHSSDSRRNQPRRH